MKVLISAILFNLIFMTGCGTQTRINGEVFMVGPDGQSQRLSMITVSAVSKPKFKEYLTNWKAELKAEVGEFDKYLEVKCVAASSRTPTDECSEIMLRRDLFAGYVSIHGQRDGPSTKSDANGNFSLDIPQKGEYFLVADSSREVGGLYERNFWAVPVSSDGTEQKILLSDSNDISQRAFKDMLDEIP